MMKYNTIKTKKHALSSRGNSSLHACMREKTKQAGSRQVAGKKKRTNQSFNQSNNKPVNRSNNEPVSRLNSHSIKPTTTQPHAFTSSDAAWRSLRALASSFSASASRFTASSLISFHWG